MNKSTFSLPITARCKVVFIRDGVNYASIIPTPQSNDQLQQSMLQRQVGMSQIQRVEPVEELQCQHPHPAQHRIVQYASLMDRP
jgi:hypothetical protein